MPWMALAIGGSALLGASASKSAANTQAAAADRSGELQERMFNKQVELQQPWQQAGQTALNALVPMATNYQKFGMDQFQQDPGYGFRLAEGQKALDRAAAARGGLISGGALKAAQRFGQDLGSQEYQNAFNRYQTERNAMLNPLQSLAGVGQTATNQIGNAASNFGTNAGNLATSAGAARASGYVGGANALASGLGQYLNYTQGQNLLNRLNPQGTSQLAGPSNAALETQMYGG